MGDLSTHFSKREFVCKCGKCNRAKVSPALIDALEELRKKAGAPLVISSGNRCPTHNAHEGGSKNSRHLYGDAVDVMCPKHLTVAEFYGMAREIPAFKIGGIGKYHNRLHLDTRGYKARWEVS